MKKYGRRNKIAGLTILCAFMGIFLIVSTYAWFVGTKTVNVSTFDVDVKGADSLSLSMDGVHWGDTVTINSTNYSTDSYTGNTNSWGGAGLVPMSSIGEIDLQSSTMKLFEKASLTSSPEMPTPGGYRLLSSRVKNYEGVEQDGYVVFDLFIRNFSGNEYYPENRYGIGGNEEAIYLTQDSLVDVAISGVANTGIENSVRVAFAEIGRVKGTETDQNTITGIDCNDSEKVTGICRDAAIWEPNEDKHIDNAINWYDTSCRERIGNNALSNTSYSTNSCRSVSNGEYYPTYSVTREITPSDMPSVDIYDGYYNNYFGTVDEFDKSKLLYSVKTFTDFDKNQNGTDREEIFYLAPNSITKVRVYIWIEGQDIDNYDFAALGKAIKVGFGFEKERFKKEQIDDPSTLLPGDDSIPPTAPVSLTAKQVGNTIKLKSAGSTDNIAVAGYKYSLDNNSWSGLVRTNSVYELDDLEEVSQELTIYTKAIDKAGNESPVITKSVQYVYNDLNNPTAPTSIKVEQVGNNLKIKASGATDDIAVLGYKYSIDNIDWSSTLNTTYEIENVSDKDKEFTIYAKAIDRANNESPVKTVKFSFVYNDDVVPTIPKTLNVSQSGLALKISASGSTDNVLVSGYKFSIDNVSWTSLYAANAVFTTGNLTNSDQELIIYAKAVDSSDNESLVLTKSFSFVHQDLTAPSKPTMLEMIPASKGIQVKSGGSTDSDSGIKGYKYSIDNTNWSSVVASGTATTLTSATTSSTIYARAVDNAGNQSSSYSDKISINNYSYTGGVQTFTAPKAGNYILEVYGAQGGKSGGKGGYAKGTMKNVTASKKLYVVVGAQGGTNGSNAYNGGGAGNGGGYAGDGGGATHIATASGVLSALASNKSSILIVAGGGGGTSEQGHAGGTGGGTSGGNAASTGYYYGYGGTQSAGGGSRDGAGKSGSFGQGGNAESLRSCDDTRRYGGGGGGGYYGGGGGGYQCTSTNGDGGGGGGSGYVNTTSLSSTSMSNGTRSGNGYATITYIGNYK